MKKLQNCLKKDWNKHRIVFTHVGSIYVNTINKAKILELSLSLKHEEFFVLAKGVESIVIIRYVSSITIRYNVGPTFQRLIKFTTLLGTKCTRHNIDSGEIFFPVMVFH